MGATLERDIDTSPLVDLLKMLNPELMRRATRPSLAAAPRAPRFRAFLRLCRRFGRWVERQDW